MIMLIIIQQDQLYIEFVNKQIHNLKTFIELFQKT